jgi:glycosyltransferase involved in cell wall biosynthesis
MPVLSVIMPVYNEAKTIREILNRVMDSPVEKEILVVDDCSTDGSRDILKEIELTGTPKPGNQWRFFYQDVNQGKGAAIRRAQKEATGQITIIQDADLEVDPNEYPKIIQPILENRADVVYGTRFHAGSQGTAKAWHAMGNKILTSVSNLFSGLHLTDMETCYKAFKTPLFQSIRLVSDRFDFEPEITAKIARRKVTLVEVPITYKQRMYDSGKKIGWKDAIRAIYVIIKLSFERGS